ncbi:MAG TPA: hypothetical protein DD611_00280 [Alphaproteobacteria bacterium]|nr:hypothetical protein [Alphaproteobacteria bacterium]
MKPIKIICALAFAWGILSVPAYAASTCTATLIGSTTSSTTSIENCINGEKYRWKNSSGTYVTVETCLDCSDGATLTEDVSYSHCTNKFTRGFCRKKCTVQTIDETDFPEGCTGMAAYTKSFGNTEYVECTDCENGYKGVRKTVSSNWCTNTTTQFLCEVDPDAECLEDSDCVGNFVTEPDANGYVEVSTFGWCSGGQCEYEDSKPTCIKGYYGAEGSTTCHKCPTKTGGIPTTTANEYGATSITECYAEKDNKGKDTAGTYSFSQNCNYSNN